MLPSRLAAVTLIGSLGLFSVSAAQIVDAGLERTFTQTVRPFVNRYCNGCHSGSAPAAQFDLRAYSDTAAVIRDLPHWSLVLGRLNAKEMPPKQVPQPPDAARLEVIDWIQAVRMSEGRKNAGDPGPVLVRRLSNSEYNNTIRDLTHVDIRPTREFPVDPANPDGFDNSGESLSMSPALLNKYLQAAREVGDHMVLTPSGFDFSPHPMLVETDREKYAIQRIVNFYKRQPTDYADYFQAAWRYKYGYPKLTLARIARESKVSAGYLQKVWRILEETKADVGPVAKLQTMWRAVPAPGGAEPEAVRAKCVEMRGFVVRLRNHTAMQFTAPEVEGLTPTSQPLMNWKLRAFASHRRDFDRTVFRMEGDLPPSPPFMPQYADLGEEAALRAKVAATARMGDRDLVIPAGQRPRYETSFAQFSAVFPDVFYVSERGRFFPDDSEDKGRLLSAGYHNVMGYFRDDTPLMELILDDKGRQELNRLWQEFEFIGDYTTRTWVQYFFNQSGEVKDMGREAGTERPSDKDVVASAIVFGLRDAYLEKAAPGHDPAALQAIRDHFQLVNDTMRAVERTRVEAEPRHLDALLQFAARAYRRPLSHAEHDDILAYYHSLRDKGGLTHEEAVRDSLVSVLMSPKFCYRVDLIENSAATVSKAAPVQRLSSYALASRLSYFLWSSMPDDELLAHAKSGDLLSSAVLIAQAHRMLKDDRASGLAIDFAGNWLDFRRFESHNAVDRMRFPEFNNDLREAMFEEPVRFIEDVIHRDRSILDMLYAKDTFVNPVLAKHYGMPKIAGENWIHVEDARPYGRGGILPMSVFLTQNAPGLRTSPVKRGYWVARRVLGEAIPPPPAVVPELPHDESKSDRPLREMLAKHRENPSCAGCHARFDSFGLAFEGYGPVGEKRSVDLAGRPVDINAIFPGGSQGAGFEGIQTYIHEHREKEFVDNFSRKLLGYALGRSLLLSDEPAVEVMRTRLAASSYRFGPLVDTIVTSPQFLNKRSTGVQEHER